MTNARVMQVATSLNSALAEYDNNVIKANYYDKTDSNGRFPKFINWNNSVTKDLVNGTEVSYTCPSDGFVSVTIMHSGASGGTTYVKVNDVYVVRFIGWSSTASDTATFQSYVRSGDVIKARCFREASFSTDCNFIKFFYLEN